MLVELERTDMRLREERGLAWFGAQSFATNIELRAYLCSHVEDWSKPRSDEERWTRVWIYLCAMLRVGRPSALACAKIKPAKYERSRERSGGAKARDEAFLRAEIAEERTRLALQHDYKCQDEARGLEIPIVDFSQTDAEDRLAADEGLRWLVVDVTRWREMVLRNGTSQPLWRTLVELREQQIAAVAENMERARLMRSAVASAPSTSA